jgi:GDP-L-fucose synthase
MAEQRATRVTRQNLQIASNVIHAAWKSGVNKLLNLGSSCIYPKHAPQPMSEDSLLTGPLEPTNEPYAIAKIAAIKLCRYFNEQYRRVPQRHGADMRDQIRTTAKRGAYRQNATTNGTNFVSAMPTNLYGPGCMAVQEA